ncbi:MAG: hypothetical protein KC432_00225 [Thermomicrobiales bacterium]|nr:hypothetical protein [Thermomicrobiales bacterium]
MCTDTIGPGIRNRFNTQVRWFQNAIAWSRDHLPADHQRFFHCLAVFAGGWTIEAAAAVSELPLREALARLEALAEQSPVVRQRSNDVANPRFTMLETMGLSGFAWLAEAGIGTHARERHARHFQELAAPAAPDVALGRMPTGRVRRLGDDRDTIRLALGWRLECGDAVRAQHIAGAMADYWAFCGDLPAGLAWCKTALARSPAEPEPQAYAGTLYGAATSRRCRTMAMLLWLRATGCWPWPHISATIRKWRGHTSDGVG